MCSPSPPPAPDYKSAAEATAAGNLEAARAGTTAGRPDEYTPLGSREWTNLGYEQFDQPGYEQALEEYEAFQRDRTRGIVGQTIGQALERPTREQFTTIADADKWRSDISLSPEAQALFDRNLQTQTGMADIGLAGLGQMKDLFSTRFNIEGAPEGYVGPEGELPTYGENRQRVMEAMMGRVDTDIDRDIDRKRSQLVASGIPVGSEAYNREMERLDRQRTDARQRAEIAATQQAGQEYGAAMLGRQQMGREGMADYTTGLDTRRQAIQEALMERTQPLQELSAFRTGSQVAMPQFQAYGQQPFTAGPDYLGAMGAQSQHALAGYNADVAQKNAMMQGLFGLGAGGLAGGYF